MAEWSVFKDKLSSFLPRQLVNFFYHFPRAVLANLYYRFPAKGLTVVGVTGTDGKTTTASLIYQILLLAGKKAALISTVSAKIGPDEFSTGLHVTSPDPWVLGRFLAEIRKGRMDYLILETTSHGLDQHRFWGVDFEVAVLTNVTREHLDYHRTFKKYLKAKGRLFKRVKTAVLNKDDPSFDYFNSVRANRSRLLTYALFREADLTPRNFSFKTGLPGDFNQLNCLAAAAAGQALGINRAVIKKGLASFKGVTGRMEKIELGQRFQVLIDFAHTPNALKNVLTTLRSQKAGGRLIVVFGCAGLRDQSKREKMGRIAGRLAQITLLTAEDPRTEDVNRIITQIADGCLAVGAEEAVFKNELLCQTGKRLFFRIPDRRKAIRLAIEKLAQKGDRVIICGKGHEQSLCFGRVEKPWSDHREAEKALEKRLKMDNGR
ncbi:MAG: UDP-N-acetylmuramoyl-L-alanyl-D-glutamate--2,6-diaminopimelate ligase [Candidatus Pacebacteria bacterium]|nr:UDP-N-acetylmuramoyl-L-alanyl-D-glutamate--2,6-diaminopimelate ligase [Candidatus Paceibacterota bacterium]